MATQTESIQQLYVAYFNRPADAGGLAFWLDSLSKGGTLASISKQFAAQAEYKVTYGGMSFDATVNQIYQNLFNRSPDITGLNFWSKGLQNGTYTIDNIVELVAASAQQDPAKGPDTIAIQSKVAAAVGFTNYLNTNVDARVAYSTGAANQIAKDYIHSVVDAATLAAATTSLPTVAGNVISGANGGSIFSLTDSVDTIVGTVGNDTINGNDTTLTGLDKIDGGAGVDTLSLNDVAGNTIDLTTATVTSIEKLVVTSSKGLAGVADVSGWTGLTNATFDLRDVAANQVVTAAATTDVNLSAKVTAASDFTVNGGSTVAISVNETVNNSAKNINVVGVAGTKAVSVTQTGTAANAAGVVVSDVNAADDTKADTITTVTLKGLNGGTAAINSDALATLNVSNSSQNITIDNDTADHALALNLDEVSGGTIADAIAKTVNVTATGKASSGVTLSNTLATAVNIAGTAAVSAALGTQAAGLTITVTNEAGVAITTQLNNDVTFTGGAGADKIIVGATTKAITTGAGDDTVTVAGVSALGTDGSINAGNGIDTLKFSTFANAVTASGGTTFEGVISGFEKLELAGANAVAGATVNLANLDDINFVTLSATNTEALTIAGLTSGGTVAFTAGQTAGKAVTVGITNALANTTDVLNVALSAATAIGNIELVAANVETVNVTSTETADPLVGSVAHGLTLSATAATTLNVSGNAGVAFGTLTGATLLTTINASGVTEGLVSFTTDALAAAATITGGADGNTIVATAATKAVTFIGGAGVDTITIANAQANKIDTGAGNDVIVVGNGANTINAGAGNDSITIGSGANTINTGDGVNTVVFGAAMAGLNTITLGAGVDTLDFNAVSTAAGYYPSVIGIAAGDKLDFVGASIGATTDEATLGAKVTLGGAASFANYLDAAASAITGGTNALVNWFQFNGNTYVVLDNSNALTFQDGADQVIELIGTIDLSKSTLATEILTIV